MREVTEQLILSGVMGGVALLSLLFGLRFIPGSRTNGDNRELAIMGLGFASFLAILAGLLASGAMDAMMR